MKIESNVPCCVCGSSYSSLLYKMKFPIQKYPRIFTIRICNKCGLLFNSPRLIESEIFKLYDSNYYLFLENIEDEFQRISKIYLRTITVVHQKVKDKKVAEVGSGKGYLLSLLKEQGWDVQGIEISEHASDFANNVLNVQTFCGTIQNFISNSANNKYPLVMAIDVLEHVPEPIEFLNHVDQIVSEDGLLIIDTPNGNCKNIEYLGKKWAAFNPFHIYFFTESILRKYLIHKGYEIEFCFTYGNNEIKSDYIWYIKKILIMIGLFTPVKKVYTFIKQKIDKRAKVKITELINRTLNEINSSDSYLQTTDAKDTLAKDFRGHNLLIIGRKSKNSRQTMDYYSNN